VTPEGERLDRHLRQTTPELPMTSPLIIMVGADKGGVGKTHVCRAVRDYMEFPALKEFPRPRLLDGQFPRGDMVQFCPGAEVINITDISDQMKVFDTLSGVTIVDIPAGLLGYTLKACDDARLLDDVRNGTLRMALKVSPKCLTTFPSSSPVID
jgi:hypothetical protein